MKALSVIISCYNQSTQVLTSINALSQQVKQQAIDAEFIICDDGSEPAQIHQLIASLQASNFPGTLISQKDKGFRLAASRNNGLRIASGKLIIFIDGDCIPEADFLAAHLRAHQQNAKTIGVGKRIYEPWDSLKHCEIALQAAIRKTQVESYDIQTRTASNHPWEAVLGRNFSVTDLSAKIYFDERLLGWGMEDLDFAIAAYKLGWLDTLFIPEAIVTQKDGGQSENPLMSGSLENYVHAVCNVLLLLEKYKQDAAIYKRLHFYLYQFTYSSKIEANRLHFSQERLDFFYQNSASLIPERLSELEAFQQQTKAQMQAVFEANRAFRPHPYLQNPLPLRRSIICQDIDLKSIDAYFIQINSHPVESEMICFSSQDPLSLFQSWTLKNLEAEPEVSPSNYLIIYHFDPLLSLEDRRRDALALCRSESWVASSDLFSLDQSKL
ncbi:glycosyltransferase [Pedobacter aquatilis]|uniref:glycosyltransferase n=1 Tax=Pedobacter aquatilis TaxID=351343 RepID=UPI00292D579A|nr:glycosyltransferase [Pedobacter aquatilis]